MGSSQASVIYDYFIAPHASFPGLFRLNMSDDVSALLLKPARIQIPLWYSRRKPRPGGAQAKRSVTPTTFARTSQPATV
jgi:hypothetical protein